MFLILTKSLYGPSEYMGHQSTWSSEYMVSISKCPTLRPGQYRPVQVKPNLIIVNGPSEYMGDQSTWVIRVHGSSEYMEYRQNHLRYMLYIAYMPVW